MKHLHTGESKHTSIMHDTNRPIPRIDLLYTDYGVSHNRNTTKWSTHNFWQMEVVIEGTIFACTDNSQIKLSEKQFIIIPPGIKHNFIYSTTRSTWSFKFNISPELPEATQLLVLPDSNVDTKKFCNLFHQLVADYQQFPANLYMTLEFLIGGLIAMNYANAEKKQNLPQWTIAAKEFIAVNIQENVNLEDLARYLNYTRIHLSRICKKSLNMKLKDFIDQEKADIIRKKLIYSHKSISEIAEETGFNDVYSFSRFYKRVTSSTPSAQRNMPDI